MLIATVAFTAGTVFVYIVNPFTGLMCGISCMNLCVALIMPIIIVVVTYKSVGSFEEKHSVGSDLIDQLENCSDEYA